MKTLLVLGLTLLISLSGCATTHSGTVTETTPDNVGAGTYIYYSAPENSPWSAPVTLKIQKQFPSGDWATERTITAHADTPRRVDVVSNRTYRVIIENDAGQQKIAGRFTATTHSQDVHVSPGGCCVYIDDNEEADE